MQEQVICALGGCRSMRYLSAAERARGPWYCHAHRTSEARARFLLKQFRATRKSSAETVEVKCGLTDCTATRVVAKTAAHSVRYCKAHAKSYAHLNTFQRGQRYRDRKREE
jgi:hypothetical protein